jgi:hypothetical protein
MFRAISLADECTQRPALSSALGLAYPYALSHTNE